MASSIPVNSSTQRARRRIHIVCGPGTGKTTLGRALAKRLEVPFYELDAVGYQVGPERVQKVRLAVDGLYEVLTKPSTPPAAKIRAADIVLTRIFQLRELVKLETRVTELEKLTGAKR